MRLEGRTAIAAPREKVFAFLTDADSVASCAPGLESLEVVSPGETFRVVVSVAFGAVKARFVTNVSWLDLEPPSRAAMKAHGSAPIGAADATASMTLAEGPGGTTELSWTAEIAVVGSVASLAARLLGGIVSRLTRAFFECVRRKVEVGGRDRSGRKALRRKV